MSNLFPAIYDSKIQECFHCRKTWKTRPEENLICPFCEKITLRRVKLKCACCKKIWWGLGNDLCPSCLKSENRLSQKRQKLLVLGLLSILLFLIVWG